MIVVLAACQAQTAPPLSPSIAPTPSAKPLPEHVVAQWNVANPSFIAFGFGSVWVTDHFGHSITRIDPVSNQVAAIIRGTGSNPEDALEVGDALWVTGQADDTTVIDPTTNTITKTIPGDLLFMDYGFDSVWVTTRDNKLDRFDPATAEIIAAISVGDGEDDCMNDVVATAAAVWVISCDTGELIKVDPTTNSVVSRTPYATLIDQAQAQTPAPAGKGTDSIWITVAGDEGGGTLPEGLLRVSPTTDRGVAFLPLAPEQAGDFFNAVTDEAVWLGGSGEINRVDVATNQIVATYPTARGRLKIGIEFGSVWLRNFEHFLIQRLDIAP